MIYAGKDHHIDLSNSKVLDFIRNSTGSQHTIHTSARYHNAHYPTQKLNMQAVINKALRFINNRKEEDGRAEELHIKYNITPLNIRIDTRAKQIWETIKTTEPEHYDKLTQTRNREHAWFPKCSSTITGDTPQAIITRRQQIDNQQ